MGREATSWDWLSKGIKTTLPSFSLLERVENGVNIGTADVNYVIRGVEGWIEMKAVALPARSSTPVLGREGCNRDQISWHLARAAVLGRTYIFITAAPYRWLVMGCHAAKVNGWTRDELCVNARFWYDDKWGKTEWSRLIAAITT